MDITIENLKVEAEEDVVSILARHSGLSKSRVKDAMTKGAVWSNATGKLKRLRKAKSILSIGSTLSLYYSQHILEKKPETPVLIDDQNTYSVWVKHSGLFSNGSRYGDHCAINRVVEKELDRPTFLVHRLDQPVWGVMVLAHTKRVAAYLSEQFQQGKVDKRYKAVVEGTLTEEATIEFPLEGKRATTLVAPLNSANGQTLVEVDILTGRKHQIRKHLSAIGHPVSGDGLYGNADSTSQLLLASTSLAFEGPDGNPVKYQLDENLHPTV